MYEFKVSGMTCGGCVKSVTNALKATDANAVVDVDLTAKLVKVTSQKDIKSLSETIEDAGYVVESAKSL